MNQFQFRVVESTIELAELSREIVSFDFKHGEAIRQEASRGSDTHPRLARVLLKSDSLPEVTQAITLAVEATWINESLPIAVETL